MNKERYLVWRYWEDFKKKLSTAISVPMASGDNVNTYRTSNDLMDYTGITRWTCPSSSVRNSLTNLPSDFPAYPDFEIEYKQVKSSGIGIQTITGGSTSSMYVAKRFFKNNTWSPWFKVTLTEVT